MNTTITQPAVATDSTHLHRAYRAAPVLWVLGQRMRILIKGDDTGERYALVEVYAPPLSDGPPPHTHEDSEELFHVLEGGIKATAGDQTTTARPGDTLIVRRGVVHTYSNPFLTPCRFLVQLTPAGFERFFLEVGVPPSNPLDLLTPPSIVPPTPEQLRALAKKHRMGVPGLTD